MPDRFAQEDVDLLLTGSSEGAAAEALPVKPYDVLRGARIKQENLAVLEAVHAGFAESLRSLLSLALRTATDVRVAGLEAVSFTEFSMSLGSPCAAFEFAAGGVRGVLSIDAEAALELVDRLLGGPGLGAGPARPLTLLEQRVVRGLVERCLGAYRDAWDGKLRMPADVAAFESEPSRLTPDSGVEKMFSAWFDVASGETRRRWAIALPMSAVEPMARGPEPRRVAPVASKSAPAGPVLRQARLAVIARLQRVPLSVRVISNLRAGQIVDTGLPAKSPVEIHVNGRLHCMGAPGRVGRRIGVRIVSSATSPLSERPGHEREGRLL